MLKNRQAKKFSYLIKNQQGGALAMVMVFSLAVGAAAFYVVNMSNVIEKKIAWTTNRERYETLIDIMRPQFLDPMICTSSLSGKNISSAFSTDGMSLLPFSMNILGTNSTLTSNWRTPAGNKLQDIRLILETGTPVKTAIKRDLASAPNLNAQIGKIQITTTKGTPSLKVAKHEQFNINVMVYYTDDHSLYSCFDIAGEAAMCTYTGGVYNAYSVTGNKSRCEPFSTCYLQGNGVVGNNSSCTTPFTPGNIGVNLYICQWCNQNN